MFNKQVANTPAQLALCRSLNLCPRCKEPKDNGPDYRLCSHCMSADCRKSQLRRKNDLNSLILKVEDAGKSLLLYAELMREMSVSNGETLVNNRETAEKQKKEDSNVHQQ